MKSETVVEISHIKIKFYLLAYGKSILDWLTINLWTIYDWLILKDFFQENCKETRQFYKKW